MKIKAFALALALAAAILPATASDAPRDILGQLGSALGGNRGGSSDSGSSDGSGVLGAIGSFINNTIANNNFTIDDLEGHWRYTSPAVSFKSDNALQNIGGAAAATALEGELEPHYRRLGFNRTSLEVDADHNFTLKLGLVQLKGKVEKDENDRLVFNFSAFGRVNLGKVTANATKAGNTLNLTFDATRLINILNKVAGAVNNTALSTLSTLLNSYDGLYMGFKLKKDAE